MEAPPTLPTCYRHGDRETRLACSACERPVCVECVRSAPVGQKCPECAAPDGRGRVISGPAAYGGGSLRERAPVVFGIIVVTVGAWLLQSVQPVVAGYGLQDNAAVAAGEVWRLGTAALLHGGLLHLGFNMYALYLFGPGLERLVGSVSFAALYVACALAGGMAFLVVDGLDGVLQGRALGASGAIFGLFGATLVLVYRQRRTAVGQAGLRQLLVLLGINLALPLVVPGIAWQAHLGGLAVGAVVTAVWGLVDAPRRSGLVRAGVPVLAAALALLGLLFV